MLVIGIPTSIMWWATHDFTYFYSVIPSALGISYIIVLTIIYYSNHEFPLRCKCDKK